MTRRLILAALALFAFLALESCGISRVAGPDAAVVRTSQSFKVKKDKKAETTPRIAENPTTDQGGQDEQPVEVNHGH